MWEYITSTHRRQNRRGGGGDFFCKGLHKHIQNPFFLLVFVSLSSFLISLAPTFNLPFDRDVYTSLLLTPLQHLQESSYTDPVLNFFFQERGRSPRDNVVFIGGGGVKANFRKF